MKILSAAETRQADAYTIENEPIASIDLMERASIAFTKIFTGLYDSSRKVRIFCGTGNNGGDGLAVARLLLKQKYQVDTYLVNFQGKGSDDFLINYERLKKKQKPKILNEKEIFPRFESDDVIIDAIFGSGLTRPVEGYYAQIISEINEKANHIVSIDIASGLFADSSSSKGAVIKPSLTISFQMPKLAFMIPENEDFVGRWEIADIGLNQEFINNTKGNYYLLTHNLVKDTLINPIWPTSRFTPLECL